MTTRERVLILAMAGAALWGGATVGMDYYQKNRAAAKIDLQRAEIRSFAEAQRTRALPFEMQSTSGSCSE